MIIKEGQYKRSDIQETFVSNGLRKLGVLHAIHFLSAKKPECTSDPECPDHLACISEKCQNPCFTTTCGVNAECRVTRHRAICSCKPGFEGDPYRICEERKLYLILEC